MLALVAQRALEELTLARMTLAGELPTDKLPPVPRAKDEADHRRVVAVALIDRLSYMLSDVASVAEDADRLVYDLAGGLDLHHPPVETEKRVFGFAAFRKAA
jgi:hypothetical protein